MAKDKLKKSHLIADDGEPAQERVKSDGKERKKSKKRQAELDPDLPTTTEEVNLVPDVDQGEVADGVLDFDVNEPTMGDKLASLNLQSENDKSRSIEEQESSVLTMPPSANSVDILLKQALHADDRSLILDCLFTQDEKVIQKTVSQLKTSHVHKFFNFLVSIIAESRGAILACALPWIKFLSLEHASVITSQESSFQELNSLNQLIGSRFSTFKSAIELSCTIDLLCPGDIDEEEEEEGGKTVPVIYEDQDSDEESDDAMDTDQNSGDEAQSDDASDSDDIIEGNDHDDDVMSE